MKSASQMVVLVTVLAALLSFTIGLPTKHRSADKFVKATDPSQKTGDYIVVLKEGATNRAEGGPSFISIILQGIANYNEEEEENYSCHESVDERQFVSPEKSAAWISSLTGKDTMFFIHLQMAYTRFQNFGT